MLFGDSGEGHSRLRAVRDVVEIVAIVAAGIWAFYIFIYENRIVPAQARQAAQFSATLQKTSDSHGLVGIRLVTKMRNISTVTDDFLGYAVVVSGQRISPTKTPDVLTFRNGAADLTADYHSSPRVPVYVQGFITTLGDPKRGSGLPLEPGAEATNEYVFYVHSGAYNRLRATIIARFVRLGHASVPTSFARDASGFPVFLPKNISDDIEQFASNVAALDLNGK